MRIKNAVGLMPGGVVPLKVKDVDKPVSVVVEDKGAGDRLEDAAMLGGYHLVHIRLEPVDRADEPLFFLRLRYDAANDSPREYRHVGSASAVHSLDGDEVSSLHFHKGCILGGGVVAVPAQGPYSVFDEALELRFVAAVAGSYNIVLTLCHVFLSVVVD